MASGPVRIGTLRGAIDRQMCANVFGAVFVECSQHFISGRYPQKGVAHALLALFSGGYARRVTAVTITQCHFPLGLAHLV